jgi:cytochrome b6-f complex iron-sulfur subunit
MAEVKTMDTCESSSKRKLVKGILTFLGVATVAGIVYPFIRYLQPVIQEEGMGGVEVPKSELSPGKAVLITYKGNPTFVLDVGGEYVALTAVCTHLGCIIKWQEQEGYFLCPCHAGKFDTKGNVIGGPPPAPLEKYPVKVASGKIIVGGA